MSSTTGTATVVRTSSSVVLDEQPSATVGTQVSLHPLPIINMSEHVTRIAVQAGAADGVRVFGALLGVQTGRVIEIQTTFEIAVTSANNTTTVDHTFLRSRLAQFKQVFPTFDFLGWYSNGTSPTTEDMQLHRQLLEYNESPLFLQLSPTQRQMDKARSAGELPIGIYETFFDLTQGSGESSHEASSTSDGGPKMLFRPAHYQVETGEAERIAVDHASKPAVDDVEHGQSSLIANLTTQRNAVQMLLDRIQLLCAYVSDVQANKVPRDHEALRQISSLLAGLPASSDLPEFKEEFLTEYNDLLLTSYLADITNGMSTLNELVDKFDASQVGGEELLGGGGGAMGMGGGGASGGGPAGWRMGRSGRSAGKAAMRSFQA